mmetsp:Transcript_164177/g.522104  ORF Transcript_164177/g.522104 Transcript_164177/m.522104 type:complete len:220 (+) Transcript_164177:777-1436(+)
MDKYRLSRQLDVDTGITRDQEPGPHSHGEIDEGQVRWLQGVTQHAVLVHMPVLPDDAWGLHHRVRTLGRHHRGRRGRRRRRVWHRGRRCRRAWRLGRQGRRRRRGWRGGGRRAVVGFGVSAAIDVVDRGRGTSISAACARAALVACTFRGRLAVERARDVLGDGAGGVGEVVVFGDLSESVLQHRRLVRFNVVCEARVPVTVDMILSRCQGCTRGEQSE